MAKGSKVYFAALIVFQWFHCLYIITNRPPFMVMPYLNDGSFYQQGKQQKGHPFYFGR
jgi:hypothetical protein